MDLRNVVFAIALSFAVLFGWSVIFETPQIEEQKKLEQSKSSTNTERDDSDVPSVNVEKENINTEDIFVLFFSHTQYYSLNVLFTGLQYSILI